MTKVLMKGNEAIAEAAIKSGCTHFYGYPITPQNQIPEYMSRRMPQIDGVFVQAESEVSAINMVYGASAAGARVMTSSSSPGISLKQEGISYIACSELPCVIVNVVRSGPGLGGILASQGDYFQSTKGGGHGDYRMLVYAPSSVQEAADLVIKGFDKADKYRIPVMILADGIIGQMMEPVEFAENIKINKYDKKWATNGWEDKNLPRRVINSLHIEAEEMSDLNDELQKKYAQIAKEETMVQEFLTEDADYIIAAFGTTARIAKNAAVEARKQGIKVGVIRPVTVWPFPYSTFENAAKKVKGILTVEMNKGQMLEDVMLAVKDKVPVDFYGTTGGFVPDPAVMIEHIKRLKEGK